MFIFNLSANHLHLHSFPTRRSSDLDVEEPRRPAPLRRRVELRQGRLPELLVGAAQEGGRGRSEEHTSELQSPDLVCRLLLEKKKEENLSFRMHGVEFSNGDMYVDGH